MRLPLAPGDKEEPDQGEKKPAQGEPPQPPSGDANSAAADKDKTESKPLGEAPEDTSRIFLRQSGVVLKPGQGQFDVGMNYIFNEIQLPTVLSNNDLAIDRVRVRRIVVPATVRYGIAEKTEIFGRLPVGVCSFEQASPERDEVATRGGLGDIGGGIKYLLREEKDKCPDVIGALSFTAPTGSDPVHGLASTGLGFWTVSGDLNFIKSYDPLTLFSGVGYTHSFTDEIAGQTFQPGETIRYSFGVGFAVNDDIVLSTQYLGLSQSYSYLGSNRIPNSIPEPMLLRFALTRVICKDLFFEPFLTVGLTSDAPAVQIGAFLTQNFGCQPKHDGPSSSTTDPKKSETAAK